LLGKRGMVICPPHLMGDENKTSGWRKYLSDFEIWDWEVRSLGKLPEALEFVKNNPDIGIIIVDEAHRFRNEDTESYHYLREICRGKVVILVSATPFNNRPSDIFSLIKLFTIPKKSSIVFDENLKAKFDYYQDLFKKLSYIKNYYNSKEKSKNIKRIYQEIFKESVVDIKKVLKKSEELAKDMRSILEPVVIRRNRLDLKYYQQNIDLPVVKDPEAEFFELTPEQSQFYDEVIRCFDVIWEGGEFRGAAYLPILYEKGLSAVYLSEDSIEGYTPEDNFLFLYQRNLYNLMRRLLVKRFESSFGAFYQSIRRFKEFHQFALRFAEQTNKYVLDKRFLEQASYLESDEIEEKLLEYQKELESGKFSRYHKIYDIGQFKEKEEFIRDIKHDLNLFGKLEEKMNRLKLNSIDSKIEKLKLKISEFLDRNVKIVIFTEYIDTAKYLFDKLIEFNKLIIPAFGNLSGTIIKAIYENFDAQYYKQEDSYSILVATDKLSEGFNLNRAGVVINYDIPWNPVRVIQRVGRINRIGKKVYNEIYIINFFPTDKGSDIVRSKEIASTKMFMIHKVLGEDSKIFAPDEEPKPSLLYRKINEYREEEEESFMTKIKKEYDKLKLENPEVINRITNFPPRVKVSKPGKKNELIVFIRRNKDIFIAYKDYESSNPLIVSFEDVLNKVRCDPNTPSLPLSQQFWENYKIILDKSHYTSISGGHTKALGVLQTILRDWDQFGLEQNYRQFMVQIIEDIREFGTIPEYVLSKIVSWEQIIKNRPIELKQLLSEIYNVLGPDFLERIKKIQRQPEEDIIVAIENVVQD
ncbi:MAG: helicase-related protein, partial [Candidatus Calescibacterium sp.]|nr:helicase-related protein [Candidatus Calescibacterium sp.]